jgi:hypothetical protein
MAVFVGIFKTSLWQSDAGAKDSGTDAGTDSIQVFRSFSIPLICLCRARLASDHDGRHGENGARSYMLRCPRALGCLLFSHGLVDARERNVL